MEKSIVRSVPFVAFVLVLLAAFSPFAGCYPKSQVYGVGNEAGLVFHVNPPQAEVFIDGVGQGASSAFTEERYLKVSPGKHVLELRLEGYQTYSREFYMANSLLRIEEGLIRK
jgi:hypothetical protein